MVSVDDLIPKLHRKSQRMPMLGGCVVSGDGSAKTYITDDGMRLVNPDGPEAAEALTTLQSRVIELEEALKALMECWPSGTLPNAKVCVQVSNALSNTANSGGIAK